MYIQGLTFLTTISIDLKFRTIKYIPNRKEKTIFQAIDEVFWLYNKRKFIIKEVWADPEFTKLSQELLDELDIYFNPVTAQAHVPEVEHSIWVIKERFRSMMHQLPYEK